MPTYKTLMPNQLSEILQNNVNLVILRFTAAWCGPCKRIEPLIESWPYRNDDGIAFYDLDIDTNVDIYSFFKTKRRLNGVPAIMAFSRGNVSIFADEFVSSGSLKDVERFLDKTSVLWQRNRDLNAVVHGYDVISSNI
jgi:thiol-disulfide isomerase/thioredoxin